MQADDDATTRLMYLVDGVRARFGDEIRAELGDHPYSDVRRSDLRLLLVIPATGTTLTQLAAMAGVTKQSLSEFVDRLERCGYVAVEVSPQDRRAKLVRPTARGAAARDRILAAGRRVEQSWRNSVGAERFELMRQVLAELAGTEPTSAS